MRGWSLRGAMRAITDANRTIKMTNVKIFFRSPTSRRPDHADQVSNRQQDTRGRPNNTAMQIFLLSSCSEPMGEQSTLHRGLVL